MLKVDPKTTKGAVLWRLHCIKLISAYIRLTKEQADRIEDPRVNSLVAGRYWLIGKLVDELKGYEDIVKEYMDSIKPEIKIRYEKEIETGSRIYDTYGDGIKNISSILEN